MKKIFTLFAAMLFVMTAFADVTRVYCKVDKSWWTKDGAAVGIYLYGGSGASMSWPGVRMSPVAGEANMWYYDVDLSTYTAMIFVRVNGGTGSVSDWGAKTGDLAISSMTGNLYTITSNEAVWGNPGAAGAWSNYTPSVEPIVALNVSRKKVLAGQSITLTPAPENFSATPSYAYEVSTDGGANYTAMPNNNYTLTAAGTYTFKVTATNNEEVAESTVNVTAVAITSLTIVGVKTIMNGATDWVPSEAANDMTLQPNGTYQLIVNDKELAVGSYEYKMATNHAWGVCDLPGTGNQTLVIETAGTYDITYTFDLANDVLTAVAQLQSAIETYSVVTYHVAGTFNSWAASAAIGNEGLAINLGAGSYEFKIIKKTTNYLVSDDTQYGDPVDTWLGNTGTMTRDNCSGWTMTNTDNCKLTADFAGEYIFTMNPANDQLTVTYPNYTRTVTAGNFGTICLPYAATLAGATAYEIAGKTANSIVLNEVANLAAGVPYIFEATAGELVATLSGEAVAEAGSANGLVGSFEGTNVAEGMYVLTNNSVKACGTGCTIAANRAYINLAEVPAATPAPEHRVIAIVEGTDVATALENANAENAQKMVVNGQLIIIKNGVRYNALGQVVK